MSGKKMVWQERVLGLGRNKWWVLSDTMVLKLKKNGDDGGGNLREVDEMWESKEVD